MPPAPEGLSLPWALGTARGAPGAVPGAGSSPYFPTLKAFASPHNFPAEKPSRSPCPIAAPRGKWGIICSGRGYLSAAAPLCPAALPSAPAAPSLSRCKLAWTGRTHFYTLAHVIQTNALGMSFCTDTTKGAGTKNLLDHNPGSTDRNFPLGAVQAGSGCASTRRGPRLPAAPKNAISLHFPSLSDSFLSDSSTAAGEDKPWAGSAMEGGMDGKREGICLRH